MSGVSCKNDALIKSTEILMATLSNMNVHLGDIIIILQCAPYKNDANSEIQWNPQGYPFQNRCKAYETQVSPKGYPLWKRCKANKIQWHVRGTPCKTDVSPTNSNQYWRHDLRNTHNEHKWSLETASPKHWEIPRRSAHNPIVMFFGGFRRLPSHQRPVKYSEMYFFRRIPSTAV